MGEGVANKKNRIVYIDLMKGLSITFVVWYHTVHPGFLDYGFRMPLFFLASAIFFKPYPLKTFAEKKIYQLLIPFVCFYLFYYLYLIVQYFVVYKNLTDFDFGCVFDVFKPYSGNGAPAVNPPLWFIMALLDLQITIYFLLRVIRNRHILMILCTLISFFATFVFFNTETYFQFGRAMRYIFYYALGYLYGKDLIKFVESEGKAFWSLLIIAILLFASCILIKEVINNEKVSQGIDFIQITSLIILLTYLFKTIQYSPIVKPLKYFGANSYIVLGMNEVILTILLLIMKSILGPLTIFWGIVHWILTLTLLIPVIKLLNKYAPYLVGKKNIFEFIRTQKHEVQCEK